MAEDRSTTRSHERSAALFDRAQRTLVGGVNSPVRAFRSVGGTPIFVDRAQGAHVFDVDGNRYVDLIGSWGPAIVGHAPPEVVHAVQDAAARGLSFGACCETEAELAEIIVGAVPSCEMIRFVNSGTEAVMSAMRLARAATGRSRMIKFHGCYHGHSDALLVSAGSGAATMGTPDSAGVPSEIAALTLLAPYNDAEAVKQLLVEHDGDVAAVLIEPVAGNMGMILPERGFLEELRSLCDAHGALLIFDEVMTGFRVAWGGYQCIGSAKTSKRQNVQTEGVTQSVAGHVGVSPDITCFGKVIGGGMPVGAFGARRELMELVSPLGPMYQSGTLSGNPLAMAAGIATLTLCKQPGFYERLHEGALRLTDGLRDAAQEADCPVLAHALGGMMGLFFSDEPVRNFEDAKACDQDAFARFFHAMIDRGVWLPPSPFEAMFLSAAHGDDEIHQIIIAATESFREVMR